MRDAHVEVCERAPDHARVDSFVFVQNKGVGRANYYLIDARNYALGDVFAECGREIVREIAAYGRVSMERARGCYRSTKARF